MEKADDVFSATLEVRPLVEERPSHEEGGASELRTAEFEETNGHDKVKKRKGKYSGKPSCPLCENYSIVTASSWKKPCRSVAKVCGSHNIMRKHVGRLYLKMATRDIKIYPA